MPVSQEMSPTTDINLVHSLMNLMDCFMDCYADEKHLKVTPESDVRTHLEVRRSSAGQRDRNCRVPGQRLSGGGTETAGWRGRDCWVAGQKLLGDGTETAG